MNSVAKKIFLIVGVLGFFLGGYYGYQFAAVDRSEYISTTDYQIELVEKKIASLEGSVSGSAFKSQLVKETNPSKKADLEKTREKKKLEKKVLEEKKKLLAQKKKIKKEEVPAVSLLQKFREKKAAVAAYKEAKQFWNDAAAQAKLPDHIFQISVEGGEIQDYQKAQIALLAKILPNDFPRNVKMVVTYTNPEMRNGMAGKGILIMKGQNEDLFFQTLVHEAGHVYSLRGEEVGDPSPFLDFQRSLPVTDPSVPYFSLSWKDNVTIAVPAFPSEYGKTNPFEDYAESFIYYILQGRAFRQEAEKDPLISKKYEFMKKTFGGKEFSSFVDFKATPFAIQELSFEPELYFSRNP